MKGFHMFVAVGLLITPGVAPLVAYSHWPVHDFGLFPLARPRFWTWLSAGYVVIVTAIAWCSRAGGGAWPGLMSKPTATSL